MSLMQQAAAQNTLGVKLLAEDRKYEEAIKVMTRSLQLIKMHVVAVMVGENNNAPEEDQPQGMLSRYTSAGINTFEIADVTDLARAMIDFNHAFIVNFHDDAHFATDEDIQVYSAAVVYNIAVAHHLQVIHHGIPIQEKSEKLYQTVMKMISCRALNCRTQQESAALLQLACCTNLAHLLSFYKGADDETAAKRYLDIMSASLFSAAENTAEANAPVQMQQGLLLLNTIFLRRAPNQIAPAA